jgi:hypothetical protein
MKKLADQTLELLAIIGQNILSSCPSKNVNIKKNTRKCNFTAFSWGGGGGHLKVRTFAEGL